MEQDKVFNLIDNYLNYKTNQPITEQTKNNYRYYYNNLLKLDSNFFQTFLNLQHDKTEFNKLLKRIKNQEFLQFNRKEIESHRSIKYFIFIQQIINRIPEYNKIFTPYANKRIEQYKKEMIKDSTEYNDNKVEYEPLKIKWSDYINKVKKITDDPSIDLNTKILFNIYRFFPLRDDLGIVLLTDKDLDNETNFYNINTKILQLNNYKTKTNYGNQRYQIPNFIADMINIRYEQGNKYMISKYKDTTFGGTNGRLAQHIQYLTNKHFGITFGINDIRRSAIENHSNKSIKSKRNLAKSMLNSYTVQQQVYNRLQKEQKETL